MDDPNITMEEYIRLEEEKVRKRGKVFNWEIAKYGKIWYDEDVHDLRSVETEISAIAFNDQISSKKHFLVNPHCFDDLDFFNDFENDFPAIVYNDALTSKLDFLTEPTVSPQPIDEFNLKDETSFSECDEEEQNVFNFNDLFPFNVIYPNDSKSDKDNDDDKVDIEHSSGDLFVKPLPDVINTDVGAYAHGSNKLLEINYLYGVSKPYGYGVLTCWTLSRLYFQHSLYASLNEYSVFDTGINMAYPGVWIRRIDFLYGRRERNINEYWWRIYKSEDLEVLES
ncbi:hypothetical protein Tco_0079451 [Tanacetum coccineum]